MNKTTKLILRLLMSPFLLCIILIRYNYSAIKQTILAVRYGGEWINYSQYDEKVVIGDIYNEIKKQHLETGDLKWKNGVDSGVEWVPNPKGNISILKRQSFNSAYEQVVDRTTFVGGVDPYDKEDTGSLGEGKIH